MPDDSKDRAGVIAPPPLIFLLFLAAAFGLDRLWPLSFVPDGWAWPGAVVIIGGSVVLAAFAFLTFRRAGTSVDPRRPTMAIISDGSFRFTRNPLYLAMTLLIIGIAIAVDGLWPVIMLVPTLIVMTYGVIRREERYLEAKFGDAYRTYKAKVRRWF